MKYFTILVLAMMSLSANAQVGSLKVSENVVDSEGNVIVIDPEVMPLFKSSACDGLEGEALEACATRAMLMFVYGNIKYPERAREIGTQGTVVVRFIVRANGEVTDAEIIRGIGGGCGKEALRVINMMPNWQPGLVNGEPVSVYFNLPLKFKLEGPAPKKKKRKNRG